MSWDEKSSALNACKSFQMTTAAAGHVANMIRPSISERLRLLSGKKEGLSPAAMMWQEKDT
jgi:hypothetical protein